MALQSSGAISLNNVNVELGNSGTASINMGSADVRNLFGVASGAISLADGYGASSGFTPITNVNVSGISVQGNFANPNGTSITGAYGNANSFTARTSRMDGNSDYIAVCAPTEDNGANEMGIVYVIDYSGNLIKTINPPGANPIHIQNGYFGLDLCHFDSSGSLWISQRDNPENYGGVTADARIVLRKYNPVTGTFSATVYLPKPGNSAWIGKVPWGMGPSSYQSAADGTTRRYFLIRYGIHGSMTGQLDTVYNTFTTCTGFDLSFSGPGYSDFQKKNQITFDGSHWYVWHNQGQTSQSPAPANMYTFARITPGNSAVTMKAAPSGSVASAFGYRSGSEGGTQGNHNGLMNHFFTSRGMLYSSSSGVGGQAVLLKVTPSTSAVSTPAGFSVTCITNSTVACHNRHSSWPSNIYLSYYGHGMVMIQMVNPTMYAIPCVSTVNPTLQDIEGGHTDTIIFTDLNFNYIHKIAIDTTPSNYQTTFIASSGISGMNVLNNTIVVMVDDYNQSIGMFPGAITILRL